MTLQEIRRLAHALGIVEPDKLSVLALIHLIQFEEGHMPCYGEAWSAPCNVHNCPFSGVCSSHMEIRKNTKH